MLGDSDIKISENAAMSAYSSLEACETNMQKSAEDVSSSGSEVFGTWIGTGKDNFQSAVASIESTMNKAVLMVDSEKKFVSTASETLFNADSSSASNIAGLE